MNISIQYWKEPDKQTITVMRTINQQQRDTNSMGSGWYPERGIIINGEGDKMQQELSAINEQYRDLSYGVWVLAYEDNSNRQYKEVLEQLNELKNLCMKLTKEKYQQP